MIDKVDKKLEDLSEVFMCLLEKSWKHRILWKLYYILIPAIVILGWILVTILRIEMI